MERISLKDSGIESAAQRAADVLRSGGIVLFPTDTLYGLGADALSDAAVMKIFSVKGRNVGKRMHSIVSGIAMAREYGIIPPIVETLSQELSKGKITFIVQKRNFNTGIMNGPETFGFRIPDNEFCIDLLRIFGGPITATSANTAGAPPANDVDSILAQLGDANIDLVIDAGALPARAPSTVLDVSGESPKILRESAVSADEIARFLPNL
ncbi:MAG: Sua5/YciO/YrdC/YwlC family protein [Candidatus Kaiserbacteria bacterium]|nr:Sua5/YciO/YrdC/YwlC family protein [Candidatus Kaiserbacteria bacterium]